MAPKNDSPKQTPKKKARASTQYLRDEAIDNESSGSVEEHLTGEAMVPRPSLPRGNRATHPSQSPP